MKYGNVTHGQVKAVWKKLGGKEGVKQFLSGEKVVKLAELFPVWKTIKLGTGLKTAEDFRVALADNGCRISDRANDMLNQRVFTVANEETEFKLVKRSVSQLGFKNGAMRAEIYQRAKKFGLQLCPPEVGPQLRLQYKNQSRGEWPRIAMEPVSDSDGYLLVFLVDRSPDGLCLSSSCGRSDVSWFADCQWVFVSRK